MTDHRLANTSRAKTAAAKSGPVTLRRSSKWPSWTWRRPMPPCGFSRPARGCPAARSARARAVFLVSRCHMS